MCLKFSGPQLFFARHGQTYWNQAGRLQGQLNSKLTSLGQRQSRQIAEQLATSEIHQIVCSNLTRAKQTAQICAGLLGCPVSIYDGLNEQNFGDWQGLPIEWLMQNTAFSTASDTPDGESKFEVASRINLTVETILKRYTGQNILLIGHGAAFKHYFSEYLSGFNPAKDLAENGQVFNFIYCCFSQSLTPAEKVAGNAA